MALLTWYVKLPRHVCRHVEYRRKFSHPIVRLLQVVAAQWLRRCATSRKVAGSRSDEVIESYQCTS
jgi:hypothetical protein